MQSWRFQTAQTSATRPDEIQINTLTSKEGRAKISFIQTIDQENIIISSYVSQGSGNFLTIAESFH